MKDRCFTLLDIAKDESLGFVKLNDDICNLGDRLGVPQYWGFASEAFFAGYMGFGSVEIHFRSVNNVVRVNYAELQLYKFRGRKAIFSKDKYGNTTSFELPCNKNKISHDFLSRLLSDEKIQFSEDSNEDLSEDTTAVIRVGESLKFYFSGDKSTLEVICIS